jgi:hypothetical protein
VLLKLDFDHGNRDSEKELGDDDEDNEVGRLDDNQILRFFLTMLASLKPKVWTF